ncbi:hypothetical protein [Halobacillus naozhouensis]|uniref:Zinc-finger n=1 Tax=Halobacillus naozhouensis TaxID=554880 RepID=A0ABY8IU61_9BACI|nr:hypothetical protein [Halobacillus naozhouensis]WFT73638.1 hypothetical protein P9989_14830 [Halobacillus naozhouensis]
MDDNQKVHLLTQELIPVIDDIDDDAKQVVLNHIHHCSECQQLYSNVVNLEESYPKPPVSDEVEIKPLKKLVQFNRGLKLLLVSIRAVILFYIIYSGLNFYDWESSAQAATGYIQGITFLFYFPASLFLIIFTLIFFSKKWLWISIIIDTIIILFIDRLIALFIY